MLVVGDLTWLVRLNDTAHYMYHLSRNELGFTKVVSP